MTLCYDKDDMRAQTMIELLLASGLFTQKKTGMELAIDDINAGRVNHYSSLDELKRNIQYTLPDDDDAKMVGESIALQYDNIETLKLLCMKKIIKLNDSKVLRTIIHTINLMTNNNFGIELQPYTIEELATRTDEAYKEFESGGGKDGELFFAELNELVMAR